MQQDPLLYGSYCSVQRDAHLRVKIVGSQHAHHQLAGEDQRRVQREAHCDDRAELRPIHWWRRGEGVGSMVSSMGRGECGKHGAVTVAY